jgi:CubicO group peptidase (beta-lactamase class C family)
LQLVIEEVSGETFEHHMQQSVLAPLGMNDSTFYPARVPDAELAAFYGSGGTMAPRYRFAAPSAAGFYSTAADLTRFVQAHSVSNAFRAGLLEPMRVPHASILGVPIWGLGVLLYAPNGAGGFVIGHDGHNAPAINATVRVDPASGDAIIVLATGTPNLASRLGNEWTFWHAGAVDVLELDGMAVPVVVASAGGVAAIALAAWFVGRRVRRRR